MEDMKKHERYIGDYYKQPFTYCHFIRYVGFYNKLISIDLFNYNKVGLVIA